MHKKQEVKPTPCPACGSDIVFDKSVIIESIVKYNPVVCNSCQGSFAFNPVTVSIYLVFALALTALGIAINFYMPYLQEIKQAYPYFKVYAMLVLVVVMVAITLLFKFFVPLLVKWQEGKALRFSLHYLMLFFSGIGFSLLIYRVISG